MRIGMSASRIQISKSLDEETTKKNEVLENCDVLGNEMYGVKTVLAVASGGLHPGLVPSLVSIFGGDFMIQAEGEIHGHSGGAVSGARPMRQVLDAAMSDISLKEYEVPSGVGCCTESLEVIAQVFYLSRTNRSRGGFSSLIWLRVISIL